MFRSSSYTNQSGYAGMNSACPCDPKTLLTSGTSGGLLVDPSKYPGSDIIIPIYNKCERTMYVTAVCTPAGKPRTLFIDSSVPSNSSNVFTFKGDLIACVIWASYTSSDFDALRKDPVNNDPDPTAVLRLEYTITDNKNGTWSATGNISYYYGMGIPVLSYMGPQTLSGVDGDDWNKKLMYTTCDEKTIQKDCPTMVNSSNVCISPDPFCQTKYSTSANWKGICDDTSGALSPYIKAFGMDKIDPDLWKNKQDKTTSTISRYLYMIANPFNYYNPDDPATSNIGYHYGSFIWPTPDSKYTKGVDAKGNPSYYFDDTTERQLYTGQTDSSGNIIVGDGRQVVNPPSQPHIKGYNMTMDGWAINRGTCDPTGTACGAQNGDYMARYTQPQSGDPNNYTKLTTELMFNNNNHWFTQPGNVYSKYVTEHSHITYGFSLDEGPYGGVSSNGQQSAPVQICILFCPTCSSLESQIKF